MLEEELKEVIDKKLPAKNLKYSLLALGYSILASVASYIAIRSVHFLFWVIIGLYFVLTIVSGVYAFLACRNSLKSLRTNKNTQNYIALIIGGLLLLGIIRQVLSLMQRII